MPFILDSSNFKRAYDKNRNITVELDYTDSDNKRIIYNNGNIQESLIIVDNRNQSCEIYLHSCINEEIIDSLQEALLILGFQQDKIIFLHNEYS